MLASMAKRVKPMCVARYSTMRCFIRKNSCVPLETSPSATTRASPTMARSGARSRSVPPGSQVTKGRALFRSHSIGGRSAAGRVAPQARSATRTSPMVLRRHRGRLGGMARPPLSSVGLETGQESLHRRTAAQRIALRCRPGPEPGPGAVLDRAQRVPHPVPHCVPGTCRNRTETGGAAGGLCRLQLAAPFGGSVDSV